MGNTDKKKSKKFTRKIRIRLADPNIPDSYICEIFDSSLENEDDEFSKNETLSPKENEGTSKPKNYFEVLMSKNCKRNGVISKETDKCKISNDTDEEVFQKRRQKSTAKTNSLTESVRAKSAEKKQELSSSRKESLLQVEGENNVEKIVSTEDSESDKSVTVEEEITNEDYVSIFDSPKTGLGGKKKLSILNYFSKTETNSKNSLKNQKLDNNSTKKQKACQLENNSKQNKNETEKTCQNARKVFLNGINKENQKLAPLFCKKEAKVVDSAKQKARLEFLYRGSPTSIKKSENKSSESICYFPKISHVQQKNESMYWSSRDVSLPLQKVPHSEWVFTGTKKFNLGISHSEAVNEVISDQRISFSKELLCKMKCKYLELGLGDVIEGLKEKQDRFLARVKKIEKLKGTSSKASNDEVGFEEVNTLWTEKYRPKSSEILGNAGTVRKLRKWLQSWKSFDDELKVLAKSDTSKTKEDSDDDVDDFVDFSKENYGLKSPGNVCFISGPNGCGKTALVYALANELEFGVLELNASSKRTGKTVLTNLQEATQSHKVHQVKLFENIGLPGDAKKKKTKKMKKKSEPLKAATDQSSNCKISLILIEDADIVYDDHDEGFSSAIASLVQTSKRPLIFLANESNCPYIENLKSDQCLVLEMEPPDFYKSCAVLDVVACLEGVQFERELVESLVCQNMFDMRKSLLELQFWSGSGRRIENIRKTFDLGHLWWGLSKFLFKQEIKHVSKTNSKGRKRKRTSELFDSSDEEAETSTKKFKSDREGWKNFCSVKADAATKTWDPSIESYFRVLDLVSALDRVSVAGSLEPTPVNECRAKDSLALEENLEEVLGRSERLTEQISSEMLNLSARIFLGKLQEEEVTERKLDFSFPSWEEIRWRTSQAKASEELSSVVSLQRGRDKRSLSLDYLPILRNICRVERHRAEINPKRKNRFYHYLNNLGPEVTEENLEINCEVFER